MHAWTMSYPVIPNFPYDFVSNDHLYARWKERHLVPDHKQTPAGACFAGFYCTSFSTKRLTEDISYQKSTGTIIGWYYHKHSEQ
jgi:Vacuolar import and degradation protein